MSVNSEVANSTPRNVSISQVNGISLATSAWYITLRRPVRIFS